MPHKFGWIRKLITYFFYSKSIPCYSLVSTFYQDYWLFERVLGPHISYVGNLSPLFDSLDTSIYPISSQDISFSKYRELEISRYHRSSSLVIERKLSTLLNLLYTLSLSILEAPLVTSRSSQRSWYQ